MLRVLNERKVKNPALVYVYHGAINGGTNEGLGNPLKRRQMGVFSHGNYLPLHAGTTGANMLVFSGRPLKEPIVQQGRRSYRARLLLTLGVKHVRRASHFHPAW